MGIASLFASGPCAQAGAAAAPEQWWRLSDPRVSADVVSVDAHSIQCAKGVCSISQRAGYGAVRADGAAWEKDLVEYDCVQFRMVTKATTYFDSKSRVIRQARASAEAWREVQPSDAAEAILTFACRAPSMSGAGLAGETVRFDQHEFVRDTGAPVQARPALVLRDRLSPDQADVAPSRPTARQPAKPAVAEPAKASPSAPAAASGGAFMVQVAAADTPEAAQQAIARLGALRGDPAKQSQARVVEAVVGSRHVYRALLGGFADLGSASALCAQIKAVGGVCFVRDNSHG